MADETDDHLAELENAFAHHNLGLGSHEEAEVLDEGDPEEAQEAMKKADELANEVAKLESQVEGDDC